MKKVWVGADWDKKKCVVVWEDDNGKNKVGKVQRNPAAIRAFVDQFEGRTVHVGIEVGESIWPRLWKNAGALVSVFDGKKAKRYAESLSSSRASDDVRSASALFEMVQSPSHRRGAVAELGGDSARMQMRLTTHEDAVQDVVRLTNKLRSALTMAHPAFLDSVSAPDAQWVLRVLAAAPTPKDWIELEQAERERLLKGTSTQRRHAYDSALADDWQVISPGMEDAVRERVRALVAMLMAAQKARKAARAALDNEALRETRVDELRQIDGLGPVLAVGLALVLARAEEGQPHNRDGSAVLLAAAPVTERSGTKGDKAPLVMMRRSAPTIMKKIGHMLGAQLVAHYRWAKAQFAHFKRRGKTAFSSYRRIARSFLRVLVALRRDGSHFCEKRYIHAARSNGAPWALTLESDAIA